MINVFNKFINAGEDQAPAIKSLFEDIIRESVGIRHVSSLPADKDVGFGELVIADTGSVQKMYFRTGKNTVQSFSTGAASGSVVQVVNTQTGAVATGTATIPYDDTIPQSTEGTEFMTLSFTPTNANNKLKIDIVTYVSNSNAGSILLTSALFQDSTANALAAGAFLQNNDAAGMHQIQFTHYMTAGTTSSTTFKVRAGSDSAGTTVFNGRGSTSGRIYGGVAASSITITEIKV